MKGAALSATMHAITIACLAMVAEAPPPLPWPPTFTVAWRPPVPVAAEQMTQPASQPATPQTDSRAGRRGGAYAAAERPIKAAPQASVVSAAPVEPLVASADPGEREPTTKSAAGGSSTRDAQYELGALGTPLPDYPWSARRRNREGRVVVRLMVAADGNVLSAEVLESSGDAALDGAARDTLSGWRLLPALANGIPVATHMDVPIRFELHLQARL